jgi:uncharacterized protein
MDLSLPRPWYREPMLWLVIAIPLLTVPAGLATVWIAASDPAATASADESARRMGQMQFTDLSADLAAAQRGIRGGASVQAERTRIEVRLSGPAEGALSLRLRHFRDPARDQRVALESLGDGRWVAHVAPLGDESWNASLESDAGWRLAGRIEHGVSAFDLVPAVDAG